MMLPVDVAKKNLILATLLVLVLLAGMVNAADTDQEKAAVIAAEEWLSLIDSGRYSDSWEKAGTSLKDSVSQKKWVQLVQPVRDPLGTIISRKIKAKTDRPALPGAPDHKAIVIRYVSKFKNMNLADEMVTLSLARDGQWRTTGYWLDQGSPDRRNIIMALLLFLVIIAVWFMELKYH